MLDVRQASAVIPASSGITDGNTDAIMGRDKAQEERDRIEKGKRAAVALANENRKASARQAIYLRAQEAKSKADKKKK